jgi:predicted dehydrogenase
MLTDLKFAIVGLGYWGPNLVRCAIDLENSEVKAICDQDATALAKLSKRYPGIGGTNDLDRLLEDPEIDGILIATPVSTHYEIAKRCLLACKHVMIEKPLASTVAECEELMALAEERDLVLMPGHTFLYSPPVMKVKELLEGQELGDLYFGTSSRVNLGIHQSDVSVVKDLAPHDFSILLYWLGMPEFVRAIGRAAIVPGTVDVVFIDLGFPSGCLVHLELSWLAPMKLRRTVLVGSEKMVVYEDTSNEQVRIFDHGVDVMSPQSFGEHQLSYRSGDILSPRIAADEPLRLELEDFAQAIRSGGAPRSSAQLGLQVVRLIEATEESLAYNSAPVALQPSGEGRRAVPDRRRSAGGMPVVYPTEQGRETSANGQPMQPSSNGHPMRPSDDGQPMQPSGDGQTS